MSGRIRKHIQQNVVGYVALFLVVSGGTAYATHPGGANTISSGDIIDNEVRAVDLRTNSVQTAEIDGNAVNSAKITTGGVTTSDVRNGDLLGADLAADTVTGANVDESSLSGFSRTFAQGNDSFAPGPANRLEVNAGLGALFAVTCDDGGTPGSDADDTVSIDVLNLDPTPFQVFIERVNAPGNSSGVNAHTLSRNVLGQFNSAGSLPAPISTHRFYVSPPGSSQTTIIAEATGLALSGGSDNCAGVVQATRSN